MMKKIELLAPGGDVNSIKAAILAGADAVYCGVNRFNARNRAENIAIEDLDAIIELAHQKKCEVFLTVNVLVVESEWPAFIKLLHQLTNTPLDGVIVQDLGALYILSHYFKSLKIHASTQLTTHNSGQIAFLKKLSATRVNLCRELNIDEIRELTTVAHQADMKTEVFVHGAYCISFSGLCYLSSVLDGKSGNRGRCSQPCRNEYAQTPLGTHFPLNLKDHCALDNLPELAAAGVDSLKIEGRIKKFDYVYSVTNVWRTQLTNYYNGDENQANKEALYTVFNRGFSNGFLTGSMDQELFTDNPRDHSARSLASARGDLSPAGIDAARDQINAERTVLQMEVRKKIDPWILRRNPLRHVPTEAQHIHVPQRVHPDYSTIQSALSILISSENELAFCKKTAADIYFQLPSSLAGQRAELVRIFRENPQIIPWIPSIQLEDQFRSTVRFLDEIQASIVVSDNLGIGMEAFQRKIDWIAGPHLNLVNSYSLMCLKEQFGCAGAFVSNELSRTQIGAIKRPAEFKLLYCIYRPTLLMTSRQCFFLNVTGCPKNRVDHDCLSQCSTRGSILTKQGKELFLEKSAGNYPCIYHNTHTLNLDILTDMPKRFDQCLIDLRTLRTHTHLSVTPSVLISLFEQSLTGDKQAMAQLKNVITPWQNDQYSKGI